MAFGFGKKSCETEVNRYIQEVKGFVTQNSRLIPPEIEQKGQEIFDSLQCSGDLVTSYHSILQHYLEIMSDVESMRNVNAFFETVLVLIVLLGIGVESELLEETRKDEYQSQIVRVARQTNHTSRLRDKVYTQSEISLHEIWRSVSASLRG